MFNWLRQKEKLDEAYLDRAILPKHGLTCAEIIYVKPLVSEPVITLLEMLKRDEWEVQRGYDVAGISFRIINVYKESVRFFLYNAAFNGTSFKFLSYEWMTESERNLVLGALEQVLNGMNRICAAEKIVRDRKSFAKLINVGISLEGVD